MNKSLIAIIFWTIAALPTMAQTGKRTILDLCEKNTSSSYKSYNKATSIAKNDTLEVRTSRYTDFYPTMTGTGTLEMYCGGERTYIGTHSDKKYPDWTNYKGNVHIYPYKAMEGSAGFYGVVMNTNGKSFSPEDANPETKINNVLANNKTVLHKDAALATEKSAAGIRIGELNTEKGSRIYGYYKSQSSASSAFYLIGTLGTDATLEGTIASTEKNGTPDATQTVGIIKEGKGTYTITGNDNQISGSVRVNSGTLLVCNDADTAKKKKLSGATGMATNTSMPVVYVFQGAVLGGTGNVGGHTDLYGTIAGGVDGKGTLHIANYTSTTTCNLIMHPASVISCTITDAEQYNTLHVSGKIVKSSLTQDFGESSASPEVRIALSENNGVKVGDTFTLITCDKGREDAGTWKLKVVLPETLTWDVNEKIGDDGSYTLSVTCTSLEDGGNTNPDEENPDDNDDEQDDEYDSVDDSSVPTGLYLRNYLEMANSNKRIGVAVPSWWRYDVPSNPNSTLSLAISNNFNICTAENEMKMDALQPQQNVFDFDRAIKLINFARAKKMAVRGHTLVWHSQCPQWVSSDGKKNDKNWTREQLLDIMEKHITTVVPRFKDWVCEWDVVNETLDDDQSILRTQPTKYQLRQESVWVKVIGESFIDSAFVYAHRANPDVKLYLNDYGCELNGTAKALAFFNLAKALKERGVPIDGVGLQCHMKPNEVDKAALDATVKKYAEIGLNCIFTEIDLAIYSESEADLKAQAKAYKDIAEVFAKNDNCPHMVMWGITDQHSWITDQHPLLFDNNVKPKPAYYSVQESLRHYTAVATDIHDLTEQPIDNPTNVKHTTYFTLDGKQLTRPENICVEQTVYTNGETKAKVIKDAR